MSELVSARAIDRRIQMMGDALKTCSYNPFLMVGKDSYWLWLRIVNKCSELADIGVFPVVVGTRIDRYYLYRNWANRANIIVSGISPKRLEYINTKINPLGVNRIWALFNSGNCPVFWTGFYIPPIKVTGCGLGRGKNMSYFRDKLFCCHHFGTRDFMI